MDDAPLILLGDFNSLPGSRPHRALTRHLRDVRKLVRATQPIRYFPNVVSRAGRRSYFRERRAPATELDCASLSRRPDRFRSLSAYS